MWPVPPLDGAQRQGSVTRGKLAGQARLKHKHRASMIEASTRDGKRQRFTHQILPPYMRRSPKVAEALPVYICAGCTLVAFSPRLEALLGGDGRRFIIDQHRTAESGMGG